MVEGNHYQTPVLKLRNGVGWFSLGRRGQPSARCRIRLSLDTTGSQGSSSHLWPGGPRAAWTSPRSAALAPDHGGWSAAGRGWTARSLQPSAMSPTLPALLGDALIVSRSASFINTCTDIIDECVARCNTERLGASGRLLPVLLSR